MAAQGNVIVFGPTGNVGSVTARTARAQGANVFLAMRDTNKSIPGLSASQESSEGYTRVQADLTKPESLQAAAQKAGATRAFLYLAQGVQDGMAAAAEALYAAGVRFVVFLSSYTVPGEDVAALQAVKPEDMISFWHASVELQLHRVFGPEGYVAIRPGYFATNTLRTAKDVLAGAVEMHCGDTKFDYITPEDMGTVAGTILAAGKQRDGQRQVVLFGPQLLALAEAAKTAGRALGKGDVTVTERSAEAEEQHNIAVGMPPPIAKYLVKFLREANAQGGVTAILADYEKGAKNVEKYAGRPGLKYEDWVAQNKALFGA